MRKYQPSNGSEGEWFWEKFCFRCERDKKEDDPCEILGRTLAFDVHDPEYPEEWIYQDDVPTCTAFTPIGEKPHTTKQEMKKLEDAGQLRLF